MPQARSWILIIDDSPLIRGLLEEALSSTFEVYCASSGEEAIALARSTTFDAVLCDLSMPGLSGLEVVQQLKAMYPLVPVIMFTESIELSDAVEAMRLGAFGYLAKGVANQALIDELHKAIAHRKVVERNQKLEADAAVYLQERERTRVVEEETTRHAAELEALLEYKTKQIAELESARGEEAKRSAIGSLIAGIAHEVNNPLAVIRAGTQFLAEAKLASACETAEDVKTALEEIELCGLRLQKIVESLRRLHQTPVEASCNPVRALAECHQRVPAGITLKLEMDPAVTKVGLSQDDLELVFSHLLSNASDAIKTRGGTGLVTIRVRLVGGAVTVEVEDDGCGISPEHVSQVCDPFFTTKPPGAAVGLGLSLVQQVVKNASGTVRIDSVIGRGTRVELCVPLAASRQMRSPAARS